MLNLMVKFSFTVLDQKYSFWANFAQKGNCPFNLKLGFQSNPNKLNSIAMFRFCFRLKTLFLSNFGPKNQICLFKLNLCRSTNSNMLILMMMFTFSVFRLKTLYLGKFSPKNQNCWFNVKFGSKTKSSVLNLLVILTFPVWNQK